MATSEAIKPLSADQLAPDPNVVVPEHVRRASAAAEEIHKQAYTPPAEPTHPSDPPNADAQAAEAAERARAVEAEAARAAAAQTPESQPDQRQQPEQFNEPADPQSLRDSEWARRYNSMYGRNQALQRTIGSMEEQMRQLAAELVRTQALISQPYTQAPQATRTSHTNLITDEDRQSYGDELIDLVRRAAQDTVSPELEALRAENQRLTQRVTSTGKRELFATLDGAIPNWRAVNTSMQFKSWLTLRNVYTGQIRQEMLKAAVDGAEAPKVIALFKDFLAEAAATGQSAPAAQAEQQVQPAPRAPALDLGSLAAPGRARPASGDSQVPSEKPNYSRAQISKFYDDKRRGLYAGRDAEVQAFEADLTAAQREGRIRG